MKHLVTVVYVYEIADEGGQNPMKMKLLGDKRLEECMFDLIKQKYE